MRRLRRKPKPLFTDLFTDNGRCITFPTEPVVALPYADLLAEIRRSDEQADLRNNRATR